MLITYVIDISYKNIFYINNIFIPHSDGSVASSSACAVVHIFSVLIKMKEEKGGGRRRKQKATGYLCRKDRFQ
jgi:hypothetical protein